MRLHTFTHVFRSTDVTQTTLFFFSCVHAKEHKKVIILYIVWRGTLGNGKETKAFDTQTHTRSERYSSLFYFFAAEEFHLRLNGCVIMLLN